MLRQYQGHHAAQTRLGERGNRAWIDPMFVERIRTDLQLDAGLGDWPVPSSDCLPLASW